MPSSASYAQSLISIPDIGLLKVDIAYSSASSRDHTFRSTSVLARLSPYSFKILPSPLKRYMRSLRRIKYLEQKSFDIPSPDRREVVEKE